MKKYLILLMFLLSTSVSAIGVDKVAHAGISWGINHVVYEVCHKLTDKKIPCLVGSVIITSTIGVMKELHDGDNNTTKEHMKDLAADGLGIVGSSIVIGINF